MNIKWYMRYIAFIICCVFTCTTITPYSSVLRKDQQLSADLLLDESIKIEEDPSSFPSAISLADEDDLSGKRGEEKTSFDAIAVDKGEEDSQKEEYCSFNEALHILGVEKNVLESLVREGEIRAFKDSAFSNEAMKFKRKDINEVKEKGVLNSGFSYIIVQGLDDLAVEEKEIGSSRMTIPCVTLKPADSDVDVMTVLKRTLTELLSTVKSRKISNVTCNLLLTALTPYITQEKDDRVPSSTKEEELTKVLSTIIEEIQMAEESSVIDNKLEKIFKSMMELISDNNVSNPSLYSSDYDENAEEITRLVDHLKKAKNQEEKILIKKLLLFKQGQVSTSDFSNTKNLLSCINKGLTYSSLVGLSVGVFKPVDYYSYDMTKKKLQYDNSQMGKLMSSTSAQNKVHHEQTAIIIFKKKYVDGLVRSKDVKKGQQSSLPNLIKCLQEEQKDAEKVKIKKILLFRAKKLEGSTYPRKEVLLKDISSALSPYYKKLSIGSFQPDNYYSDFEVKRTLEYNDSQMQVLVKTISDENKIYYNKAGTGLFKKSCIDEIIALKKNRVVLEKKEKTAGNADKILDKDMPKNSSQEIITPQEKNDDSLPQKYYSFEETMKKLQVTEDELNGLIKEGDLQFSLDGEKNKFLKEDVDSLMTELMDWNTQEMPLDISDLTKDTSESIFSRLRGSFLKRGKKIVTIKGEHFYPLKEAAKKLGIDSNLLYTKLQDLYPQYPYRLDAKYQLLIPMKTFVKLLKLGKKEFLQKEKGTKDAIDISFTKEKIEEDVISISHDNIPKVSRALTETLIRPSPATTTPFAIIDFLRTHPLVFNSFLVTMFVSICAAMLVFWKYLPQNDTIPSTIVRFPTSSPEDNHHNKALDKEIVQQYNGLITALIKEIKQHIDAIEESNKNLKKRLSWYNQQLQMLNKEIKTQGKKIKILQKITESEIKIKDNTKKLKNLKKRLNLYEERYNGLKLLYDDLSSTQYSTKTMQKINFAA